MGQRLSCGRSDEHGFFSVVQYGDLETLKVLLERNSSLVHHSTVYDRQSALHIAAANGHIEVVSMLIDQSVNPDLFNRYKQTPLMLAAMHGNISCVQKLIEAGANILMFDSLNGRTCLHYAAYYGNSDCLTTILSASRTSHIASSWGYARFVNFKDGKGATPLHLAARQKRLECVHILVDNGALACASTGGYGFPGSTPLHWAARGGSLDCIRELLAWGADRLQRDDSGSAIQKFVVYALIKYTIQVQDCRHQMCAHCVLALCSHKKPNPTTTSPTAPVCPFCRSDIVQLDVIKVEKNDGTSHIVSSSKLRKSRRSRNFSGGSSSFKGLSAVGSFGKMVSRGSGRIAAENEYIDKPIIVG
ncbi:unnamed protein product [Withania somnifera]